MQTLTIDLLKAPTVTTSTFDSIMIFSETFVNYLKQVDLQFSINQAKAFETLNDTMGLEAREQDVALNDSRIAWLTDQIDAEKFYEC